MSAYRSYIGILPVFVSGKADFRQLAYLLHVHFWCRPVERSWRTFDRLPVFGFAFGAGRSKVGYQLSTACRLVFGWLGFAGRKLLSNFRPPRQMVESWIVNFRPALYDFVFPEN